MIYVKSTIVKKNNLKLSTSKVFLLFYIYFKFIIYITAVTIDIKGIQEVKWTDSYQ
jgi:hypothetical protein